MKIQQSFNGWAFSNPDFGKTIIRCHSTATEVINWVNSRGDFHYNLIDLEDTDIKFLYVITDDNEVIIENYIGDEENVEIPSQIEGYPVTGVAKCYGTYKYLTIPSTVKKIGSIFSSNLENIYVDSENERFTSKDGVLFSKDEQELICYPMGKKEESYNIPEGTTSIGGNTSVTIGNIRYTPNPFDGNMYLKSLYIPASVIKVNNYALNGMENLSEIFVDEENKNYFAKDNILYKIDNDKVDILVVPNKIEGNVELFYGLTNISTYTFKNTNNIESIVVPTTVTNISHNAFYNCNNLKKIVISGSTTGLTEINDGNLCFGNASSQLKVYCEAETVAQQYSRKWKIDYEIIEPTKIEIKQNPEKISYIKDKGTLNLESGLITITYDDGTALDLAMTSNLLNITGFDNSKVGENQIEIDYKGKKTSFYINIVEVEKKLTEISVTTAPANVNYIEGQNFDTTGMVVTATYNDGTSKEVTNYTVIDGNNLTVGKTSVTISYTENGVTKTATQGITVNEDHTWNIGEVTKEPTCKDKGEKIYTCTVCGETRTEEIAVTDNHTWNTGEVTKEPTCKDKGERTYICTVCNKTKIQEIAENGHKHENGVCVNCGENIFTEESKYYIILSELIGISPNTIIGKFITNIMEKYTVKIMKDNQEVTEGKIATGMQIKIFEKEQEVDSCTTVVTGDTDGNGNADIRDMIKINNYRLYGTTTNFEGAYQTAGDVNRDGKIDIKDMIRINNYRLYNTSI